MEKERGSEKQQLYDVPASPQKAGLGPLASQPSVSMMRRGDLLLGKCEPPPGRFISVVQSRDTNASEQNLFHLET